MLKKIKLIALFIFLHQATVLCVPPFLEGDSIVKSSEQNDYLDPAKNA